MLKLTHRSSKKWMLASNDPFLSNVFKRKIRGDPFWSSRWDEKTTKKGDFAWKPHMNQCTAMVHVLVVGKHRIHTPFVVGNDIDWTAGFLFLAFKLINSLVSKKYPHWIHDIPPKKNSPPKKVPADTSRITSCWSPAICFLRFAWDYCFAVFL